MHNFKSKNNEKNRYKNMMFETFSNKLFLIKKKEI